MQNLANLAASTGAPLLVEDTYSATALGTWCVAADSGRQYLSKIMRFVRSKIREKRVTIRLAGALRRELEAEAEADSRPLAAHIRKVLTDRVAARLFNQEPSRA